MFASTLIKPRMEVLGSDGVHVGIVDHLDDEGAFALAKDDLDAGGETHSIPLTWVIHVEMKVHLRQPGAEVLARWKMQ
jgi:hypothetical protein